MHKFKFLLSGLLLFGLFSCTPLKQAEKETQTGYLKSDITQAELNNTNNFKRYDYYCKNTETNSISYLATYFPLWKESRLSENFGFYFQLDNTEAVPFDHIENKPLNKSGTRFEVRYRSYQPIQGDYVELKAKEKSSIYIKNHAIWLNCKGG